MVISEEERNRVRCSVALSVPLVLRALADHNTARDQIQHLLPTYVLKGIKGVSPYFAPWMLRDTGKKRVYVNADGYRIRYITRKMLNGFENSVSNSLLPVDSTINRYANRWVIMRGEIRDAHNNWGKFVQQVILVERQSLKENHPPLGTEGFASYLSNFDLMNNGEAFSLEKYSCSL